jgi:ankyrin repeat protein
MIQFVNAKSADDGFTALHFCSFKGNVDLCMFLIEKGADKFATNNFGINMLHTAAQGDMPISLYYFY